MMRDDFGIIRSKTVKNDGSRLGFAGLKSGAEAEGGAERSLLDYRATVSHFQRSMESLGKCGKATDTRILCSCGCGSWIKNVKWACNLRICKKCMEKRRRRIKRVYLPFLKRFRDDRNRYSWKLLTLSPRNYMDLKSGYKDIRAKWSKFIRKKYISDRIKGGLFVIEFKNIGKGWNIHIHALILARYLDQKRDFLVKKSWNGEVIVDIRRCSLKGGLSYSLKYMTEDKQQFKSDDEMKEFLETTRLKHHFNRFGFSKLRPKKFKWYCLRCKQDFFVVVDFEVVDKIEELRSVIPRPKGL